MKAKPPPFDELQGRGLLDLSSASDLFSQSHQQRKWDDLRENCCVGTEPTSVLDSRRSPSPITSSSTLSSSLGSGGRHGGSASTDTSVAAVATTTAYDDPPAAGKCGLGMEDWDHMLSDFPGQDQSVLKLVMGDIEDPSGTLNKFLQTTSGSHQDLEFDGGFGLLDQGLFESNNGAASLFCSNIDLFLQGPPGSDIQFHGQNVQTGNGRVALVSNLNTMFPTNFVPSQLAPGAFQHQQQLQQQSMAESAPEKPQIFQSHLTINQNQVLFPQNPTIVMPSTYAHLQEHQLLSPPPAKRLNSGGAIGSNYPVPKMPFAESGQELFVRRQVQPQPQPQQQVQLLAHQLQQKPAMAITKQKIVNDELVTQQLQQRISDQLFEAAELIKTGHPVLAQGILARLNHQLSPIGKPFQRAAFYFTEALQLLLQMNASNSSASSPFSLIFKIEAYKSFSEISPVLQFANFTGNQVFLESVEGFDVIHIVDFDIGYGGQWASFMQELSLRNGGAPSLKITAFVSASSLDEFELRFTQENLKQFASDLNIKFELDIVFLESLDPGTWPHSCHVAENEAVAVNLPVISLSNCPLPLPLVLRFLKQLSPKIVVSLDRGFERTDAAFPNYIMNALQSYSAVLESLDAVNMNLDAQQKIEKYLLQPVIEKTVLGFQRWPERSPPWRTLFLSSGFTPLTFSNFTESQAECLVQRTPVRGFHVEKKQGSLVLCWQHKELISASAWKC